MKLPLLLAVVFGLATCLTADEQNVHSNPPWTWECINNTCTKLLTEKSDKPPTSFEVCKLTCLGGNTSGVLWPKPTGKTVISDSLVHINYNSIYVKATFQEEDASGNCEVNNLIKLAGKRFTDLISSLRRGRQLRTPGKNLSIHLKIRDPTVTIFETHANESYGLKIKSENGEIIANISADNFLGARHGLETLSQCIIYDSYSGGLVMPSKISIQDKPAYTHRGVLVDTSRNFISLKALKKNIEAMAMNKLNTFHWHITDSHSFPFVSKSHPELSRLGAYSPEKVYTEADIKELVEYSTVRGVRVVPEFDAPAHVGEGWQQFGDAVVCLNKQPWTQYCVEPPCGQLNPTSEKMYSIVEGIYKDMNSLFKSDIFHMGGDEVNFNCWNTTESIVQHMKKNGMGVTESDFLQLWSNTQNRFWDIYHKSADKRKKIVLWTSTLTTAGQVEKYLDNEKYIIQIWTLGTNELIRELVDKDFQVVFSNYDALYFDCGFGAWVGTGNNWCSPYIPWQTVYGNDPYKLAIALGANETLSKKNILGSEATLWTEQADDKSIENRIWPRAAAMAEGLWSKSGTWQNAEHRLLWMHKRMVENGLSPDTLQPQWCQQNPGNCYL